MGRSFDFITNGTRASRNKDAWVARTDAAGAFVEVRPVAGGAVEPQRRTGLAQAETSLFRLVVPVTERTIDKKGSVCWCRRSSCKAGWTSLDVPAQDVIDLYKHHGTHEQFHSEIKTDLDLERLPSGKFDTNDAIVHLASFAYNCLRLLGNWD